MYMPKNYHGPGGDAWHIGGRLEIESGGTLEVKSGGAVTGLPEPSVQALKAGTITFAATSGTATKLTAGKLPKGAYLLGVIVDVTEAFNAATTNTLQVGTSGDPDAFVTTSGVTAGTAGVYEKLPPANPVKAAAALDVYATYTQSGTAATAGSADVYLLYILL